MIKTIYTNSKLSNIEVLTVFLDVNIIMNIKRKEHLIKIAWKITLCKNSLLDIMR